VSQSCLTCEHCHCDKQYGGECWAGIPAAVEVALAEKGIDRGDLDLRMIPFLSGHKCECWKERREGV
jgi:hypothetical protein